MSPSTAQNDVLLVYHTSLIGPRSVGPYSSVSLLTTTECRQKHGSVVTAPLWSMWRREHS